MVSLLLKTICTHQLFCKTSRMFFLVQFANGFTYTTYIDRGL